MVTPGPDLLYEVLLASSDHIFRSLGSKVREERSRRSRSAVMWTKGKALNLMSPARSAG